MQKRKKQFESSINQSRNSTADQLGFEQTNPGCRRTIRLVLGTVLLLGSLAPSPAQAQTGAVKMNFCDQTILDDPFADSKAVLVSGISTKQESDFVPRKNPSKSDVPQTDDLTSDPNASEALEEAIETLELKKDKSDKASNAKDPVDEDPIEKRGSDDPVESPTFNLTDEDSDDSQAENDQQSPSGNSVQQNLNDGYQLPTVGDVRAPISYTPMSNTSQNDPSNLLLNDQDANFDQRYFASFSNYAEITGMPTLAKYKTWQAHNVYHRPTYFEDQNLELNGNQRPFQNVTSALSFFTTIPRVPYLIGEHYPNERIYTYGEDRPGDPAPYRIYQPLGNRRGQVFQTIATLGLILP